MSGRNFKSISAEWLLLKTINQSYTIAFEERKKAFKTKYSKKCPALFEYINTQWLTGSFTKWQIFYSLPGYASTNSNIESFNAVIKRDFTFRQKMSIKKSLIKIREIVEYYSAQAQEFVRT